MKDFNDAFEALIGHEKGYVNHPLDPGGETMYGVTKKVARKNGYMGDMKLLTLDMARKIAKTEYWDLYKCDEFDIRIGFQIFDIAYNGGKPVQWLQRAAGEYEDGILGPKTISAVLKADVLTVIMKLNSYRISYYTSLLRWPVFGKGWANRVAKNLLISVS
jgi:lysozyme family protein